MFTGKVLKNIICKLNKYQVRLSSQNVNQELIYTKLSNNEEGIAVMTMNRPKQKNSFSTSLVNDISHVVDEVATDNTVRTLIIRSLVPGVFCAGQ